MMHCMQHAQQLKKALLLVEGLHYSALFLDLMHLRESMLMSKQEFPLCSDLLKNRFDKLRQTLAKKEALLLKNYAVLITTSATTHALMRLWISLQQALLIQQKYAEAHYKTLHLLLA